MKDKMMKLMAAVLTVLMLTTPLTALAEGDAAPATETSEHKEAPKKEAPKKEAPKPAETKKEEPKSEAPKAEAPKAEEPKSEAPKAEAPKAEAPKSEAPKAEEPKSEAPKAEAPKSEAPKAEEPKAEAPKAEEPKTEAPKAEEPKSEAPKAEEPKAEEPKAEEPKAEEPKTEEPKAEEPKTEEPKAEEPAADPETTAEPDVTAEPEQPEEKEEKKFSCSVSIKRTGSGAVHYDDRVTLKAVVKGANLKYDIRWEVNKGGSWQSIDSGAKHTFTVTEDNADWSYRVVVIGKNDSGEKTSSSYKLSNVTERQPDEPIVEDPEDDPEDEIDPETEAPAETEEPADPEVTEDPETEEPTDPEVTEDPEATEAPADPETTEDPEATEAPADPEATEEPTDPEATEEPTDPEATEEPAEPEKPAIPEFTGNVLVVCDRSAVRIGDQVTLQAVVTDANVKYSIRWEANAGGSWRAISSGSAYTFTVNENNANLTYRAVLISELQSGKYPSDTYKLNVISEPEAPVDPEATEEPIDPEATEEPVDPEATEEPVDPEATEEPIDPEATEEPIDPEDYEGEISSDPEEEAEAPEEAEPVEDGEEAEPEEAALVVTIGETPVRTGADGLSEIFVTLPEGTEVTVIAIEGDWAQVEIDGQIGYIFIGDLAGLPEAEPEVDPEAETDPTANMKVTIFSSRRSQMTPGETVHLTSKISGFDGYEIKYQWECNKGGGFQEVSGANGASYSFKASVESLSWDWRLTVYYR